MGKKAIGATEFKSKCLKLMKEVAATGEPLTISHRNKKICQLVRVGSRKRKSLFGCARGYVRTTGDVISPIDAEWEALE